MKQIIYICVLLSGIFLLCCEDLERGIPVSENDTAPGPVSNVEVENIPGGATLTYKLPESENLLYVLAEYSRGNGIMSEKKSSYYDNSITLEGFPDEASYDVKLYAVSRGGKKSTPVIVNVNPLTPPIISTFQSIFVGATFGGIYVNFENESEADLKINVLTTDSIGNLYIAETFYTKRKSGSFSVRGFDVEERIFGVFVRDRWNNYSDTLFQERLPLFERELDKNNFAEVRIDGENWMANGQKTMAKLWDGVIPRGESNAMFANSTGFGFPQTFTFDLGVTTTLSRFKYYPRADGQYAYSNNPQLFEIWGTSDINDDESWIKLLDCEVIKPSGEPQGTVTTEDREYCWNGIEYEFPSEVPPVRYIKFKTLKVWSGTNIAILELSFWGSEE